VLFNYGCSHWWPAQKIQFSGEIGLTKVGKAILHDPQVQNSYSCAANNPITRKDADGRLVESVSRPIADWNGFPSTQFGAHAVVYVVPDNPTIGSINGANTSAAFILSGIPTKNFGGTLIKKPNDRKDRPTAHQVDADLRSTEYGRLIHDKGFIFDDVDTVGQRDPN